MQASTPGSPFGSRAADDSPGTETEAVLGNEYRVLRFVRGGMAEVFICESLDDPELKIAFKTFRRDLANDRHTRLAFLREVSVWVRISGLPHIMPAIGIRIFDRRPYIGMPVVGPGSTLRDLLMLHPRLPVHVSHPLAFQLAYGMLVAQRELPGLVHGDLKPENLFVRNDRTILISDFGMSRILGDGYKSIILESSWPYLAPECWSQTDNCTALSDIYAFGVILYEIVSGARPWNVSSREEWKIAHRDVVPRPPSSDADPHLLQLALRCLEKDPNKRPENFNIVLAELDRAAGFENAIAMHMTSNDLFHEHRKFQASFRPNLIEALVQIEELDLALSELDRFPDDLRDASYWALRGSTLAMKGRHEEALDCFDVAMKDKDHKRRYQWESERALSLKRLGRVAEAIAVYHKLLLEVPDAVVPHVVGNLATVYLERRDAGPVIRLLRRLTQAHPDSALAWANLGEAYRQLNRFEEAESCLRRAQAADPLDERFRTRLAVDVLAVGMARVPEALALLEHGLTQGDQSARQMAGLLACYQLLGKEESLRDLAASLRAHFPTETTDRLFRETHDLALRIVETGRNGPPPPMSDNVTVQPEEVNAAIQDAWAVLEGIQRANPELPNATMRLEASAFSFVFYDDLTAPDYLATFARAWRAISRTLGYRLPFRAPRSNPFYFTLCPGCGIAILTNRDPGVDLECQLCHSHHSTNRFESTVTASLLARVHESLGKHLVDLSGRTVLLLLQPKDVAHERVLAETCKRWGFEPVPDDSADVKGMLAGGYETDTIRIDQPFTVWGKVCPPGSLAYLEDAPPEIQRLLLRLDNEVQGLRSMSVVAGADPAADEEFFRSRLRKDPRNLIDQLGLMETLLMQGKFDQALGHALAATRTWPDDARTWSNLARVEQGRQKYAAAIEHAERAIQLDPSDRRAWLVLVVSHRASGDAVASQKAADGLANLGTGLR